jgi:hypothetical protein
MDVVCKRCAAAIEATDVHLESRLAKCGRCGTVFDFSAQLDERGRRAPVPLPRGLRIVEDEGGEQEPGAYRQGRRAGGRLVIVRRWFSTQLFFQALFCVLWDGFLFSWYATPGRARDLWFTLFPFINVAVGVAITYRTLAGFFNRTWITATPASLTIRHGPLPWLGNREIAAGDIAQLHCKRETGGRRNPSVTYSLAAVMKDGRQLALVRGLAEAEQALFIEQRVEERLDIAGAPVGSGLEGAR